ncbi:PEP-CTERM sorting domain-containing protein [Roseimaritima ulvae]|uniref:Ice-binding protein C-terminal domain-containing protein n=1 Tax=Roseimaritima ulvae TaxID=980254 RepID=A0A5B9QWK9_9BACT|nr:PEP-CTERM sorting domain-containing protein [Roseimaritima ulvae]QEG38333.1 hypothetical protein UC8_02900 [Roseimaritima ulvae]
MFSLFKENLPRFVFAKRIAMVVVLVMFAAPSSDAGILTYDQDVSPDVIVGTNVANGGFTVDRSNGIEVGLRAKVRFNANNQAENTFNSNGDGSYTFEAGQPAGTGFSFAPNSSSTAVWSFDWSINSNFGGVTDKKLDQYRYELAIDFNPATAITPANVLTFDPINGPDPSNGQNWFDHAFGDNTTTEATRTVGNAGNYAGLITTKNVAQNSWNMEFFDVPTSTTYFFDANVPGTFDISLSVFELGGLSPLPLASTQITVHSTLSSASATVPEPASMLTFAGLGLCALGVRRKRRRSQADVR